MQFNSKFHFIFVSVITIISFLASSSPKKALVFAEPKKDEIITKNSLHDYLKGTKNPSIILRVPAAEKNSNVSKETYVPSNTTIYNTIEKEFLRAGYNVRDRQLYDKVLDQKTSGYSDINTITNTDLIVEFLGSTTFAITTNQYKDEKGKMKSAINETKIEAVKAEFKIVKVKENELAGSYTFYFTPCLKGCSRFVSDNRFTNPILRNSNSSNNSAIYYDADNDSIDKFYQNVAVKLIAELKK